MMQRNEQHFAEWWVMLERCYKYLDNIFGQKFNKYANGP